ncbi:MAG TPA: hypothetical protein VIH10_00840 [Kribbella sp.]
MGKTDHRARGRLLIAAGILLIALLVSIVALTTNRSDMRPPSIGTSQPTEEPIPTATGTVTQGEPSGSATPSTRPTGPATSQPPTSREQYEQAARRELEQGLVAYNPPTQARVQEDFEVTVRVQRGTATVAPSLKTLPGTAPVVIEKLPVGTYMRGELRGSGFTVQPLSDDLQLIDGVTEWAWRVTPESDGLRTLRLTLVVELNDLPLSNRTFDRSIDVAVKKQRPWYGRATGLLDVSGVVTALVIAALLGAAKLARVRWLRRKAEEVPADEHEDSGPPAGAPDEAPAVPTSNAAGNADEPKQ